MGRKTAAERDAAHALRKGLKAMFGSLAKRPAPDRFAALVDQLDGTQAVEPKKKAG